MQVHHLNWLLIALIVMTLPNTTFAGFKFSGTEGSLNVDQPTSSLILAENILAFNGTLKCASSMSANIQSATGTEIISFETGGAIKLAGNTFGVQGTYDPKNFVANNDSITLQDGDALSMVTGNLVSQDIIVGSNATASISGSPAFGGQILLTDMTSTLELALQDRIEKNIVLNGGTVKLADDLRLKDGFSLNGSGTVQLGGNTLEISNTWSGDLEFQNSGTIKLVSPTTLSGNWNFSDVAGSTAIQGDGHTLNLNGGSLQVAQDHELILTDLRLQGLGLGGQLNLFDSATNPGKIILRSVTIELDASYVVNSGILQFDGSASKIVSAPIVGLQASGSNTSFIIDRVVVYFDALGSNPTNPFSAVGGANIDLQNGGKIKSTASSMPLNDVVVAADANNGLAVNVLQNRALDLSSRILIENNAAPAPKAVTIDGNGAVWSFPSGGLKVLILQDGVAATLQNVSLKSFSLDAVQIGTNSSLLFGDGVVVDLSMTTNLPSSGENFNFVGNARLSGHSQAVILNQASALNLNAPAKKLVIHKGEIYTQHLSALLCQNSTATIELQDCSLLIDATGLEFANGNLEISGSCAIKPVNSTGSFVAPFFTLSTPATLTINSGATLQIDSGCNFIYAANPSADLNNTAATKRHLIMADASSTLFLNGCTITSTGTALALDKGNLIIDGKVNFNASTNPAEAAELGSALNSSVLADAQLIINGNVNVIPSTI